MTEELLAQPLESPSRTGRGRVPESSPATLPAAPDTNADTQNSTAPILTGHSERLLGRKLCWVGDAFDDVDQFVGAVAVVAGELDKFACAGLRRARVSL